MIKFVIFITVLILVSMITISILVFLKPQILQKGKDKNGDVISADGKQNIEKNAKIEDVKSFIPLKGLEAFAMDLGGHNYRAIVECSSVNYALMSGIEQDMVEASFTRFLNSLSFPIMLYIQTREFDNETMMETLHNNIIQAEKRFSGIKEYARIYESEMDYLTYYINNSKTKKKYIIISYNKYDLADVSALTNYEIKEFALEELRNRCAIVMSGLAGVGLSPVLLDKEGIAECLYSYYHRDFYRIAKDIVGGEFTSLTVDGVRNNMSNTEKMQSILYETQNKINSELCVEGISQNEKNLYQYIINSLEYFRQNTDYETLMGASGQSTQYENNYDYYDNQYSNIQ